MTDFTLLCVVCLETLRDPLINAPQHVVNLRDGTPRLYDVFGQAKCPECPAIWYRGRDNKVVIVGLRRKPPKRALVAKPVTRKPPRGRSKVRSLFRRPSR